MSGKNQPRQAEPDARVAEQIDGCTSPRELRRLGKELLETREKLAARAYRRALRLDPNDGAARNNLGVALWNMGNRGDALREFLAAARLLPTDRNVIENVAGALLDSGRREEARRWFARAAALAPGTATELARVDLHGY